MSNEWQRKNLTRLEQLTVYGNKWWERSELLCHPRTRFAPHWNPICWGQVSGLVGLIVEIRNRLGAGNDFRLVELGSYNGESGAMFAGSGMFSKIWLVDRWASPACEAICEYNMRPFGPMVEMVKGEIGPIELAWTERVDVVYIDANHTHEAVRQSMGVWWDLLHPGGILCGHDYNPGSWPGVVRAVDEFAAARGLQIQTFRDQSWLLQRPEEGDGLGELRIEN